MRAMDTTTERIVALLILFIFGLVGGIPAVLGATGAAIAIAFVCLGVPGDRGEQVWLRLTIAAWIVMALWIWRPAQTECPADGPANCTTR